jgi:hypothetical protein
MGQSPFSFNTIFPKASPFFRQVPRGEGPTAALQVVGLFHAQAAASFTFDDRVAIDGDKKPQRLEYFQVIGKHLGLIYPLRAYRSKLRHNGAIA